MPDGERDGMKRSRTLSVVECPKHGPLAPTRVPGKQVVCGRCRAALAEVQYVPLTDYQGTVSRAEEAEAGMHSVLLAYRVKELECQRLREQVDDLSLPREDDRG